MLSDGERCSAVRLPDGSTVLPSVVRIDARGQVTVGARARRFLESDPENTRGEFKRLMGSGRKLEFRSAKTGRTPEELSCAVLATLRAEAERVLGHAPEAAVVTVPALFELPQIRATSEAARLAGFQRVEHLQEPVASALSAGYERADDPAPWLVYDLGGGTFDVSLLATREGVLRVVDHDGDNFLGGRDMDARLLEAVLAHLSEVQGRPFRRADPELAPLLRRLRLLCEEAKFELGAGRDTSVSLTEPVLAFGEEVTVDVPISVAAFEAMTLPLVDRSIAICERMLARTGIAASSLGRLVLVGGPTVMPVLRRRLQERLVDRLARDVDPMTAVAEGAARFAVEHGLMTRSAGAIASGPSDQTGRRSRVWLQYPSVSGDPYPFVVGRREDAEVVAIRARRSDGAFTSALEEVDEDGTFALQLELRARVLNSFTLVGVDRAGVERPLDPSEIHVRHGLSLADPPLARTIGIALANDSVLVFFERGSPLPSRKSFRLKTAYSVRPGDPGSALRVPVVQGEVEVARLCRLVGTIDIRADRLTRVLVAGTPVDVVLELDRGGNLTATAHLPDQGLTFDGTLALVSPQATAPELETNLAVLRGRAEVLFAEFHDEPAVRDPLVQLDALLDEAELELEAARGGDPDALEKVRRMTLEIDERMAEVEAFRMWPELERTALETLSLATYWIGRAGTEMERRLFSELTASLQRARAVKNATDFERRRRDVVRLTDNVVLRVPDVLAACFEEHAARASESRDPRAFVRLVERGRDAARRGDWTDLRASFYALVALLPPEATTRARAHDSGVQR